MKKIVTIVLLIVVVFSICVAVTACSKDLTPKDELVELGPFATASGSYSITFNEDGTS